MHIPAFDLDKNGLLIKFHLTAITSHQFLIDTKGNIAEALQRNFKRVIETMASMKKSWECLKSLGYVLDSRDNNFVVKDSKSSSIALINIYRVVHGQLPISGLTGTGILRIDGSFDNAHLEEKKYLAAQQNLKVLNKFITAKECKNLFDLENFIEQFLITRSAL